MFFSALVVWCHADVSDHCCITRFEAALGLIGLTSLNFGSSLCQNNSQHTRDRCSALTGMRQLNGLRQSDEAETLRPRMMDAALQTGRRLDDGS